MRRGARERRRKRSFLLVYAKSAGTGHLPLKLNITNGSQQGSRRFEQIMARVTHGPPVVVAGVHQGCTLAGARHLLLRGGRPVLPLVSRPSR